jgi:predicted nuclease of predicted toxin-antitoxin system
MKIKLDENLPVQISLNLRALGHDVHTIPEERLSGSDDDRVWAAAQREGRFLVTQDLDFSDERKFAPGTRYGIAVIRLRQPSRRSLVGRTEQVFRFENTDAWRGCFVVITEHKVRVRRGAGESTRRPSDVE